MSPELASYGRPSTYTAICDAVTGCSNNHASFYQGNVQENNLRHIWENRFEDFRKRSWLAQTSCADCREAKRCRGGSIHLWKLGEPSPAFCYYRPVANQGKTCPV